MNTMKWARVRCTGGLTGPFGPCMTIGMAIQTNFQPIWLEWPDAIGYFVNPLYPVSHNLFLRHFYNSWLTCLWEGWSMLSKVHFIWRGWYYHKIPQVICDSEPRNNQLPLRHHDSNQYDHSLPFLQSFQISIHFPVWMFWGLPSGLIQFVFQLAARKSVGKVKLISVIKPIYSPWIFELSTKW